MTLFAMDNRGLFNGIRVPGLDIPAICVGFLGLVVYQLGLSGLETLAATEVQATELVVAHSPSLLHTMLGNIFSLLGTTGVILGELFDIPTKYQAQPAIVVVGFALWTALVWSFLAGALMRIAAVNIAKDDSMSPGAAIAYGLRLTLTNFMTIVGISVVLAMLYLVVNTLIFGTIAWIPYLGDLLLIPIYLLAVASSLVMVVVATFGGLGLHLSAAAVATELTDGYGGISRAWGYLLNRFWTYVVASLTSIIVLVVILTAGQLFLKVTIRSLATGSLGLGQSPIVCQPGPVTAAMMPNSKDRDYSQKSLTIPGKGTYLYNRIVSNKTEFTGRYIVGEKTANGSSMIYQRQYLQAQDKGQIVDVLPAIKAQGLFYYTAEVVNVMYKILKYLVISFALFYFFASQTVAYFLLRHEMDGDKFHEINMGDEDDQELFQTPSYPGSEGGSAAGNDSGKGPETPDANSGGDSGGKRSLPMVMEV